MSCLLHSCKLTAVVAFICLFDVCWVFPAVSFRVADWRVGVIPAMPPLALVVWLLSVGWLLGFRLVGVLVYDSLMGFDFVSNHVRMMMSSALTVWRSLDRRLAASDSRHNVPVCALLWMEGILV